MRYIWPNMSYRALVLPGLCALLVLAGCSTPGVRQSVASETLLRQQLPRTLPVPVDGVASARLVNTWGAPRDGGRGHRGIDIFAPRGTPVRSTTEGVIEVKGMRGLGGLTVTVLGPGGYRHYYAHLEDLGPQTVGEWVHQGEIIGYVGNSGNAAVNPTHLHYGIYSPSGQAVNPYPFLRGQTTRTAAR